LVSSKRVLACSCSNNGYVAVEQNVLFIVHTPNSRV